MLNLLLMTMPNLEDENKFSEVYNTYSKYVFGIASKFFSNNMDKEDAVYTSLFKISQNLDKIDDINSVQTKAFIAIITKNTCITIINKRKKIKEIPYENINDFADDENLFEEVENKGVLLTTYCKCLKKLSQSQYELLYLRYVNDLSLKQIASILNIKENAVKQRLHTAKHKLCNLIMEDMSDEQ